MIDALRQSKKGKWVLAAAILVVYASFLFIFSPDVHRMLRNAVLIAPPVINNFTPYNELRCFINEYSGPTIEDAEFMFCLE